MKIEKKDGRKAEVTARNDRVREMMADAGSRKHDVLNLSLTQGEKVTIISEAAEGFHAAEYSVTTDGGEKEALDFDAAASAFKYEITIGEKGLLFEAKMAKASGPMPAFEAKASAGDVKVKIPIM